MKMIQIENKAATVKLDDVVTKGLIDPLIDKIATLYGDDAVRNEWTCGEIVAVESDALETLEIEIDSVGGSVAEGYRLYKTLLGLRERGVKVTANITKTAASMGSVIAMAADHVRMVDTGTFMIHDAQATVKGDADRMRQVTNDLDQVSEEIAGIYALKTGQYKDAIRSCMKGELYMNAKTALRYKFVDEVYESAPKEWNPSILERLIGNKAENPLATNATLVQKQSKCIMSLLDKLRPDADLTAKLELAESDNAAISAELEEAKGLVTNAAEEIAGLKSEIEGLNGEKETLEASLTGKDEEIVGLKASLEAEQAKTTPDAITKLVTAQLAQAGHPPIETSNEEADEELSKAKIEEKFKAMSPGEERTAFFNKHKEVLAVL